MGSQNPNLNIGLCHQMMVGNPIYNYYQSHRSNFKGVTIIAPQQQYSAEPILFFSNQKVRVTPYTLSYSNSHIPAPTHVNEASALQYSVWNPPSGTSSRPTEGSAQWMPCNCSRWDSLGTASAGAQSMPTFRGSNFSIYPTLKFGGPVRRSRCQGSPGIWWWTSGQSCTSKAARSPN